MRFRGTITWMSTSNGDSAHCKQPKEATVICRRVVSVVRWRINVTVWLRRRGRGSRRDVPDQIQGPAARLIAVVLHVEDAEDVGTRALQVARGD